MPNFTEHYGLIKPDAQEFYDVKNDNDNADLIDAELKNVNDKVDNALNKTDGHKHTGADGDAPKISADGLEDDSVSDDILGNRTITDTIVPNSDTNNLTNLLGNIGYMLKLFSGKITWRTAPAITLEAVSTALTNLPQTIDDRINVRQEPLGIAKPYFSALLPSFHLWCDGKTIGDDSSNASGRANADVHDLFSTLWSATGLSIFESNGNPSGRGTSAEADWVAHKRIALPDLRNRVLRGLPASGRSLGDYQADAFQGHRTRTIQGVYGFNAPNGTESGHAIGTAIVFGQIDSSIITDGVNGTPRTDTETRMMNLSCNWILRY